MDSLSQPLTDTPGDERDRELVGLAKDGNQTALEQLILRHQPWIYNLALRMLHRSEDARDVTQEALIKLFTRLSTFDGRSSFRTWLYRIVVNHLLNMKRGRAEARGITFQAYGHALDNTPDEELADATAVPVEAQLLTAEARIGCTMGMLLCLDREQRLVFIFGGIFGVSDTVGAELLELSRDNFRQKLARARRDLQSFMLEKCGLINAANSCRCARKTRGFIKAGHIDPANLRFAEARLTRVRDVAPRVSDEISALDAACAEIYREHPFAKSPDFVAALRELLQRPEFRTSLDLN